MQYEERSSTINTSQLIHNRFEIQDFLLLTSGTGTGKTFVAIRSAYLMSPKTHLLCIAPLAKLREGGWPKSVKAFNEAMNAEITLHEFHYEALTNKNGPNEILKSMQEAIDNKEPVLLVFDEAHLIKLSSDGGISNRAKKSIALSQSGWINKTLAMSATATPNSYLDNGTYFVMAGFYRNKTQFLDDQILFWDPTYYTPIVKDPYTKKIDRRYFRDPDKLDNYTNQIAIFQDGQDTLPPVERIHETFVLDDQRKYTDDVFFENYQDHTKRTRLGHYRQAVNNQRKGYYFTPSEALADMRRIATPDPNRLKLVGYYLYDEWFHQKDPSPVLILYQYNQELDTIKRFMKSHKHVFGKDVVIQEVNGRKKEIKLTDNPKTVVLIQYQAGAAAIEFPESHLSIFYSPTYSYQNYSQAQGRNVRSGSTHPVRHVTLEAVNTIETNVWETISNKKSFSQHMMKQYFQVKE